MYETYEPYETCEAHENTRDRPLTRAPQTAGITDGVVELRKRRPSAPGPGRTPPPAGGTGAPGTAADPTDPGRP